LTRDDEVRRPKPDGARASAFVKPFFAADAAETVDRAREPNAHRYTDDAGAAPESHLAIARRLKSLRDEGILIVATGNVVHNLRTMRLAPGVPPFDWASRFEERTCAAALAGDDAMLLDLDGAGPDASASVPSVEHYLPFLYAYGAGSGSGAGAASVLTRGIEGRSISMLSMRFD
jgi:4,5-DOPA dioxygenase extradiol